MTTKSDILRLLHTENRSLSKEIICTRLGLERNVVNLLIQELSNSGYEIQTSPTGYRLVFSAGSLFPWEFPARESRFHFFPTTVSTMDVARDMARNGCPDFTVITTDHQSKGRGRLGRTWISDPGGLYCTIVVRPLLTPSLGFRVNFAASVILARLLRDRFDLPACVKWPNDILINGRKISGMLSEMELEGERISFINIGIGVNINNDPSLQEPQATSIRKELGKPVPRKEILSDFLDAFEQKVRDNDLTGIIDEWKSITMTIGTPVRIVTTDREYSGVAVDVDQNGALILESPDGSRKKILYGDCFLSSSDSKTTSSPTRALDGKGLG